LNSTGIVEEPKKIQKFDPDTQKNTHIYCEGFFAFANRSEP
jgi:hypothetical protein